ncbi:hypothetical protein CBL_14349 [Carabus blaptoides fortunei]
MHHITDIVLTVNEDYRHSLELLTTKSERAPSVHRKRWPVSTCLIGRVCCARLYWTIVKDFHSQVPTLYATVIARGTTIRTTTIWVKGDKFGLQKYLFNSSLCIRNRS